MNTDERAEAIVSRYRAAGELRGLVDDALQGAIADAIGAAVAEAKAEFVGHGPLFVDATPDGGYALRLLRAYLAADGDSEWRADPPSAFVDALNDARRRRAAELTAVIEILERARCSGGAKDFE